MCCTCVYCDDPCSVAAQREPTYQCPRGYRKMDDNMHYKAGSLLKFSTTRRLKILEESQHRDASFLYTEPQDFTTRANERIAFQIGVYGLLIPHRRQMTTLEEYDPVLMNILSMRRGMMNPSGFDRLPSDLHETMLS